MRQQKWYQVCKKYFQVLGLRTPLMHLNFFFTDFNHFFFGVINTADMFNLILQTR